MAMYSQISPENLTSSKSNVRADNSSISSAGNFPSISMSVNNFEFHQSLLNNGGGPHTSNAAIAPTSQTNGALNLSTSTVGSFAQRGGGHNGLSMTSPESQMLMMSPRTLDNYQQMSAAIGALSPSASSQLSAHNSNPQPTGFHSLGALSSGLSSPSLIGQRRTSSTNNQPSEHYGSPVSSSGGENESGSPVGEDGDKNKQCACKQCGKIFNSVWYLKQHAVKHSSERPFKCKFCHKTYRFRSNLYQHKCPDRDKTLGPKGSVGRGSRANGGLARRQHSSESMSVGLSSPTESVLNTSGSTEFPQLTESEICLNFESLTEPPMEIGNQPIKVEQNIGNQPMNVQEKTGTQPMSAEQNVGTPPMNEGKKEHPTNGSRGENDDQMELDRIAEEEIAKIILEQMNGRASPSSVSGGTPPASQQSGRVPLKSHPGRRTKRSKSEGGNYSKNEVNQYLERFREHLHQCLKCRLYFPNREYLTRHMASHEWVETRIKCLHCSESFQTERNYALHKQRHAPSSHHICPGCNGKFRSRLTLKRHQAVCKPSSKFKASTPTQEFGFIDISPPASPNNPDDQNGARSNNNNQIEDSSLNMQLNGFQTVMGYRGSGTSNLNGHSEMNNRDRGSINGIEIDNRGNQFMENGRMAMGVFQQMKNSFSNFDGGNVDGERLTTGMSYINHMNSSQDPFTFEETVDIEIMENDDDDVFYNEPNTQLESELGTPQASSDSKNSASTKDTQNIIRLAQNQDSAPSTQPIRAAETTSHGVEVGPAQPISEGKPPGEIFRPQPIMALHGSFDQSAQPAMTSYRSHVSQPRTVIGVNNAPPPGVPYQPMDRAIWTPSPDVIGGWETGFADYNWHGQDGGGLMGPVGAIAQPSSFHCLPPGHYAKAAPATQFLRSDIGPMEAGFVPIPMEPWETGINPLATMGGQSVMIADITPLMTAKTTQFTNLTPLTGSVVPSSVMTPLSAEPQIPRLTTAHKLEYMLNQIEGAPAALSNSGTVAVETQERISGMTVLPKGLSTSEATPRRGTVPPELEASPGRQNVIVKEEKKAEAKKRTLAINAWKRIHCRFQCLECARRFKKPVGLRNHMVSHWVEGFRKKYVNKRRTVNPRKAKKERKGYQKKKRIEKPVVNRSQVCPKCGIILPNKRTLNYHVMHYHKEGRPFLCRICGRGFKYASNLKDHYTVHENFKRYYCKECGRGFKLKPNWRKHTMVCKGAEYLRMREGRKAANILRKQTKNAEATQKRLQPPELVAVRGLQELEASFDQSAYRKDFDERHQYDSGNSVIVEQLTDSPVFSEGIYRFDDEAEPMMEGTLPPSYDPSHGLEFDGEAQETNRSQCSDGLSAPNFIANNDVSSEDQFLVEALMDMSQECRPPSAPPTLFKRDTNFARSFEEIEEEPVGEENWLNGVELSNSARSLAETKIEPITAKEKAKRRRSFLSEIDGELFKRTENARSSVDKERGAESTEKREALIKSTEVISGRKNPQLEKDVEGNPERSVPVPLETNMDSAEVKAKPGRKRKNQSDKLSQRESGPLFSSGERSVPHLPDEIVVPGLNLAVVLEAKMMVDRYMKTSSGSLSADMTALLKKKAQTSKKTSKEDLIAAIARNLALKANTKDSDEDSSDTKQPNCVRPKRRYIRRKQQKEKCEETNRANAVSGERNEPHMGVYESVHAELLALNIPGGSGLAGDREPVLKRGRGRPKKNAEAKIEAKIVAKEQKGEIFGGETELEKNAAQAAEFFARFVQQKMGKIPAKVGGQVTRKGGGNKGQEATKKKVGRPKKEDNEKQKREKKSKKEKTEKVPITVESLDLSENGKKNCDKKRSLRLQDSTQLSTYQPLDSSEGEKISVQSRESFCPEKEKKKRGKRKPYTKKGPNRSVSAKKIPRWLEVLGNRKDGKPLEVPKKGPDGLWPCPLCLKKFQAQRLVRQHVSFHRKADLV